MDQKYFRPEYDFWSNCNNESACYESSELGTEVKVEETFQFLLISSNVKINRDALDWSMTKEVFLIQTWDQKIYIRPKNDFWSNCTIESGYYKYSELDTEVKNLK